MRSALPMGRAPHFLRIVVLGIVCTSVAVAWPARAAAPTVTPVGQGTIVFVSDDTGLPMIMSMEPDGGTSANALTNGLAPDRGPDSYAPIWSPDSSQIAFSACSKGSLTSCLLYVMNDDGSLVQQVTAHPAEYDGVSWSPDGKSLVYASRDAASNAPNFYVVSSDGSDSPKQIGGGELVGAWPSWSPDGTKIVYQTVGGAISNISIMNADGSNPQTLTSLADSVDMNPVWSPDGKSIAF